MCHRWDLSFAFLLVGLTSGRLAHAAPETLIIMKRAGPTRTRWYPPAQANEASSPTSMRSSGGCRATSLSGADDDDDVLRCHPGQDGRGQLLVAPPEQETLASDNTEDQFGLGRPVH